jgi:hypothetical protein
MVKYTEKLLEKGEERKRLTKQLALLVGAVANDIAQSLPEGSEPSYDEKAWKKEQAAAYEQKHGKKYYEVHPPTSLGRSPEPWYLGPWWRKLKVIRIKSNIGEARFLALFAMFGDSKPVVFAVDQEPGTSFFLDNDSRRRVEVASAEDYLKFANSIPEIVAGFEKKAEELTETLRNAFDELKEIASAKA